jgi:lysophospholipase L1-like esterase
MKLTRVLIGCVGLLLLTIDSIGSAQDSRPVLDDKAVPKEIVANTKLPTIFIVGDSTVKNKLPLQGWGEDIGQFFDLSKVNVVNRAIGGRSSRTFQHEGRWDDVCKELKPGDFVLIQFGHNDVGQYDDAKGRASLHGESDDTREVTGGDGKTETVHTFGWYLRKYGTDAKAGGAQAVFCSMIPHKVWDNGKVRRGEQDTFVKWTANAAQASGAAFINLNEIIAREYEKLGQEKVESLFADKGTHTSPAGAELNARSVVAGLRALPGAPIDGFLSEKGKAISPAPDELVADSH